MKYDHIKIYTDGGSRGNPGPSAAGYVITDPDDKVIDEGGLYLGITTNNQAEHRAVLLALEQAAKFAPQRIDFYMDSQLVANQLTGVYRVKNQELKPVIDQVKTLLAAIPEVNIQHVLREYNKLADAQVNIILDQQAQKD